MICIIIIACFAYAHIDKLTYIYDKEIDTSEFVNTGIIEDTTITQTFISNEDSLDGVQTKCTVAGKVDNVQIEYELKEADSGKTVSKGSTAGSEIKIINSTNSVLIRLIIVKENNIRLYLKKQDQMI